MSSSAYIPANSGKHAAFAAWAQSRGITHTKITPAYFPNAGLGIVSTAPIAGPERTKRGNNVGFSAGEVIAFTPTAVLLTRENVGGFSPGINPRAMLKRRGGSDDRGLTTHAVFAAAIAREAKSAGNAWKPWMDVWPTLEEFAEGLPMLWKETERVLLPPSTKHMLEKQMEKFESDYKGVAKRGFDFPRHVYMWAWLVVNTRSLFYKPDTPEYKELAREDCMALCPFIDYFNHSDDGCQVQLSAEGYTVSSTTSACPAATQIFVTYGCHSNDFLLVEYGFILPSSKNKWDEVSITSLILPGLSAAHKDILECEGFLGNYMFDKSTFCFRTQAAARLKLIDNPSSQRAQRRLDLWRGFLSGSEDGERERFSVEEFLLNLLDGLQESADEAAAKVEALQNKKVADIIKMRWEQILDMKESVKRDILGEGDNDRQRRRYVM